MINVYLSTLKVMFAALNILELPLYSRKDIPSFLTYVNRGLQALKLEQVDLGWKDYHLSMIEDYTRTLIWSALKLGGYINDIREKQGKPRIKWVEEAGRLEDNNNG